MMKDNQEQDLIEKYIYDVVRRLPQSQRKDIELELRSIIYDMIEDSDQECANAEDILKKLGTPAELARKYRGEGNYLIGPEHYDQYCLVLKIVLICTLAGAVISAVVSFVTNLGVLGSLPSYWIKIPIESFMESLISLITGFGIVTLVFAVIERQKTKIELIKSKDWTPSSLPEIPEKKALLGRGDAVAELVLNMIFFGLIVFAPRFLGVWLKDGEHIQTVPIFNLNIWISVRPLFLICFVLNLSESIVKLVVGKYGAVVAVVTTITNLLSFGVSVIIFKCFPIWNPDFVTDVQNILHKTFDSKGDIFSYWGTEVISNFMIGIIFFAVVIEIGTTLYRSIRYGEELRK